MTSFELKVPLSPINQPRGCCMPCIAEREVVVMIIRHLKYAQI